MITRGPFASLEKLPSKIVTCGCWGKAPKMTTNVLPIAVLTKCLPLSPPCQTTSERKLTRSLLPTKCHCGSRSKRTWIGVDIPPKGQQAQVYLLVGLGPKPKGFPLLNHHRLGVNRSCFRSRANWTSSSSITTQVSEASGGFLPNDLRKSFAPWDMVQLGNSCSLHRRVDGWKLCIRIW